MLSFVDGPPMHKHQQSGWQLLARHTSPDVEGVGLADDKIALGEFSGRGHNEWVCCCWCVACRHLAMLVHFSWLCASLMHVRLLSSLSLKRASKIVLLVVLLIACGLHASHCTTAWQCVL